MDAVKDVHMHLVIKDNLWEEARTKIIILVDGLGFCFGTRWPVAVLLYGVAVCSVATTAVPHVSNRLVPQSEWKDWWS